ncbi:MAG: tetratricopeptide repeat protein [Acidobacteriota bacterium]
MNLRHFGLPILLAVFATLFGPLWASADIPEDPPPTPEAMAPPPGGDTPQAALDRGNALAQSGQWQDAAEVYGAALDPRSPHPTLAYNLGVALHRLDRLPEAILWYRRGPQGDPWLQENLWLARRNLGSQALDPGPWGAVTAKAGLLAWVAVGLAWLALFIAWIPGVPRGIWILVATAAVAVYGVGFGLDRWGPEPAVLLTDCTTSSGDLPAGTEAWVRPGSSGALRVLGTKGQECAADSIARIHPPNAR